MESLERCLEKFKTEHPEPKRQEFHLIAPKRTVWTPAKRSQSATALSACEGESPPVEFSPYSEVPGWYWIRDEYEVRAVYDNHLDPKYEKYLTEAGRKGLKYKVRVETDWVRLRRLP